MIVVVVIRHHHRETQQQMIRRWGVAQLGLIVGEVDLGVATRKERGKSASPSRCSRATTAPRGSGKRVSTMVVIRRET
jgi:hypothetical protein